jgi:hypothetical protein
MHIIQKDHFIKICISLLITSTLFVGCIKGSSPDIDTTWAEHTITPVNAVPSGQGDITLPPEPNSSYAVTYHGLDGNRVLAGTGSDHIETIDITLQGKPIWIVASAFQQSSIWYVILENGQAQAFQISNSSVQELRPSLNSLPGGMPPVLIVDKERSYLPIPPGNASILTHSIFLQNGIEVFIDDAQQLHLKSENDEVLNSVKALPDARILTVENDRILFLSDPTGNYTHAVLGDAIEADSITLIDTRNSPFQFGKINPEEGDVFEGISPIWVDIDLDGTREIIVTQSNEVVGARIVVYREDGSVLAESAPIGKGFRWMHQIAAAQFIDGGPLELAVVRTPHIGGEVEILGLTEDRLEVKASLPGYSTHKLGSRNLDTALAADFNGDGFIELIAPGQDQTYLSGIQFLTGKLMPVWTQHLDAQLSTNLVGIAIADQQLLLGVGTDDNSLRIWIADRSSN